MAECPASASSHTTVGQEFTAAGINAVLGGLTAAAFRLVQDEPVGEAFVVGALGGGVTYVGKRVAVESFFGAGLIGRELASVGGSMVGNASASRGALDRLVLPLGPVRLYTGDGPVRMKIDGATVLASLVFMGAYGARLDPGASLSAGALVFRGEAPTPGLSSAGAMVVWSDIPASEGPRLMAHERVHVLQYDQLFLSWGEPIERWAVGRVPELNLFRYVDTSGAAMGIRGGFGMALHYQDRPWEQEAYLLAQRAHPIQTTELPHTH